MQASRYIAISGATGGLGTELALTLAGAGRSLLLGGRNLDKLKSLRDQIQKNFKTPVAISYLDVCDPQSVQDFFSFSTGQLEGFVHTAAVLGAKGSTEETDPDEWKSTIETNLVGTYLCVRMAALKMEAHGEGSIVALSGGGASGPLKTLSAYASSKVAVVRLVETMAEELTDKGIRINAVAPGVLPTRMNVDLIENFEESLVDGNYLREIAQKLRDADGALRNASELILFLLESEINGLTGRLISAVWDNWRDWKVNPPNFDSNDLYRIRRQIES